MLLRYPRFTVISLLILGLFAILFVRLARLTLFEKPGQENQFEQIQHMRGFIYSADRSLMAISVKTLSLYANPLEFDKENYREKYIELFKILKIGPEKADKIWNFSKKFIWVKRFIEKELFTELQNRQLLDLPGISHIKEYKRFYPQKELSAQTIGFVGDDGHGLSGIEYSMEKWLSTSKSLMPDWEKEDIIGNDVILTINLPLQKAIEEEVYKTYLKTSPKNITTLVMDASTGGILSMVNFPSFDINSFRNTNPELFRNNAISYIDEPGSTFKPLVMASLMEQRQVHETDEFHCGGKENIYGFTISDERPHGTVNPRKIIAYSCNVGMALASRNLGKGALYEILKKYALGQETGLLLPGEEKGIIRIPSKMTMRSMISIPIGQEVGLTPIQLVSAFTALANDGELLAPRIIEKVEHRGQSVEVFPVIKKGKVLSKQVARTMLSYMEDVVNTGTGKDARIPGVKMAGKTGTAQIFDSQSRTYSKINTSFISILENKQGKRFIIYAVIRNPGVPEASGGKLAAPLVRNMALRILEILK